ncbi:hypothetical protein BLL42_05520 [Pseudomonas frederiksbergensis]|uniref:Uncharacterized protein n=1 Tax=Pseudomonas frederiksbergensis TaxID=104087 RepID=A0A1J0EGG1_9PSED|nr:UbiA family prenyltransferase [Pseudomonas frederiksbergensis]APC15205.1 hypothetical protein BLL42_05520 [Pseudomonas frederiksbergensis]
MKQFTAFCSSVFPLGFYCLFAFLWLFGMQAIIVMYESHSISIGLDDVGVWLVVILLLLFTRLVDEVKDYEYDKINNPERPLVTGAVSRKQILIYSTMTGALIVALNQSTGSSVLPLSVCIYTLLIWGADKKISAVSTLPFFALMITFPVSIQIYYYVLFYTLKKYEILFEYSHLLLPMSCMLSFLALEILRKTRWETHQEGLYSTQIGPVAAHLCGVVCGVLGVAFGYYLVRPVGTFEHMILFLPYVFLLMAIVNFFLFKCRKRSSRFYAVIFLLSFYAVNLVVAVSRGV